MEAEPPALPIEDMTAELATIYEEASDLIAPLHSRLAQHKGLLQFGVEFANRAPPWEQRMLVPSLEARIEDAILKIGVLAHRVQMLEFAASHGSRELRRNVRDYVGRVHREAKSAFEGQRGEFQQLAVASPLLSPMMTPELCCRFAEALKSPRDSTSTSPPLLSTAPSSSKAKSVSPTSFDSKLPDTSSECDDLDEFDQCQAFQSLGVRRKLDL
jgi:hypothetical protein